MSASPHRRLGSIALTWLAKVLRVAALSYLGIVLVMLLLENWLVYPAPRYPVGDWEAAHLPHEDVHFTSADGTKLHGWFVEHPHPRAVVLYCHGNGEHVADNAYLLEMLRVGRIGGEQDADDFVRLAIDGVFADRLVRGRSGGTVEFGREPLGELNLPS